MLERVPIQNSPKNLPYCKLDLEILELFWKEKSNIILMNLKGLI